MHFPKGLLPRGSTIAHDLKIRKLLNDDLHIDKVIVDGEHLGQAAYLIRPILLLHYVVSVTLNQLVDYRVVQIVTISEINDALLTPFDGAVM